MKTSYELATMYDNRNSFGGKARVEVDENCMKLYSYNTLVAMKKGDIFEIYNVDKVFSDTTSRHIKEFYYQNIDSSKEITTDELKKFLVIE